MGTKLKKKSESIGKMCLMYDVIDDMVSKVGKIGVYMLQTILKKINFSRSI